MQLTGNKIILRLVEEEDSYFILKLRQNKELNKYISSTDITVEQQKEWIKKYKIREENKEEYYFIILNKEMNQPCGTVRIYNIDKINKVATWGSFILDFTRPDGASKEVIDISLNFVFKELKLKKIELDVRKANKKAIHIYEKNGFIREKEDDINYYYRKEK
ncbi:GNAT family N-acetyltransferase [uncultured Fusobacterium sp.]|uniref:GNAT family N-acetyltransferase n=1 Tax=uncultured Fusobacterium sp. TaxID=159267 RepID=UPI0025E71F66|nr:GNAT family N-acetyltransferase [uncultured Fusobacterium sp.]